MSEGDSEGSWSFRAFAAALVIGAPPFAYALYEKLTYSGITRWLAEKEIDLFGGFYENATVGIVMLLVGLLWGPPVTWAVFAPSRRRLSSFLGAPIGGFDWTNMVIITPIVGLGVYGAAIWISAAHMGPRVDVDVDALERGEAPPGRYVRLIGKPMIESTVTIENSKPTSSDVERKVNTYDYVPVVSSRWAPGDPVAAFIKLEPFRRWLVDAPDNPAGTLELAGLGPIVTFFEREGVKVSKPCWLIAFANTPEKEANKGKFFLAASPATGLLAWAIAAWKTKRERRAKAR